MRATGAVPSRHGRTRDTGGARWTAALAPLLWGACAAGAAVGLATTAHAAALGLGTPALGAGTAVATRCSATALVVAPVLASTPNEVVAYRVTDVSVTGAAGCTGATLLVTVRSSTDSSVTQVSKIVPAGGAPVTIPLGEPLDPTVWYGWAATVVTS